MTCLKARSSPLRARGDFRREDEPPGDNARAAALFAAFVAAQPRDARAEDAAYLRVIALQRAGKPVEMKRAAEYPGGFMRDEVEPLAR